MRSPGIVQRRSGCLPQRLPAGGGLWRGSRVWRLRGRREDQWSPAWRAHHARACARDPSIMITGVRARLRARLSRELSMSTADWHTTSMHAARASPSNLRSDGGGRQPPPSVRSRVCIGVQTLLAWTGIRRQTAAWRPPGWTGHEQSNFTCTDD